MFLVNLKKWTQKTRHVVHLRETQMISNALEFFPLPVLPAHVRDSIPDPSVEIHVVLRIEL